MISSRFFNREPKRAVCANCGKPYRKGDRHCRFCGKEMGKPRYVFEPTACVYGPPPIKRNHTCKACGYSWDTYSMIDDERWCPECGGAAPAVGDPDACDLDDIHKAID